MRRFLDALALCATLILGAWLRLSGLARPSLWLDEILDYDVATNLTHQPLSRWVTGFASEHGPLFFGTELAGRIAPSPELAARIAPAVFGIATIVVAWIAAQQLPAPLRDVAPAFALLLAGSPLAIDYSREARPYALLVLLATAVTAVMLHGEPSRRMCALALALPVALLATTSGAAPLLVATAITAFAGWLLSRSRLFATLSISAASCAALMPLLYRGAAANAASSFPPLNPLFWQRLAQAFSIDATNSASVRRIAYVLALLALIGAVALLRRDRIRGVVAIGMAVLPVAIGVAALHHLHHWYTVRYVITALPAYLLLAAIGASSLVPRRASAIIAMLVAAFIVHEGWSAATTEPYRKLNWRLIAATIHEHAQPNDLVLTTNDWSYVSLEFYLRRLPPRVRLRSAGESVARADAVLARNAPAWIVSAGFHRGGGIGDWSCRYPVVLASALESFRLHYAPGLRHLVMNRLTAADRRALVARYPTQLLHMTNADDFYLSGGWYGAEGTGADIARWTNGEPASVLLIGAPGDHRVTLRMLPHGGSQTVAFTLNGAPLAQFAMPDAWHEYALDVPRARWLDGANVLTLTFAHAIAPAALDPRSRDHRPLAAMVQEIVVTAPGAVRNEPLTDLTRALRINEAGGELLDGGDARPPVPASLLARIGIDPTRRVSAADAAAAVAYDSACLSDEDFLRVAYATLLGRALDRDGARYFLAALQKKDSRVMVARALVTSDEFRRARR